MKTILLMRHSIAERLDLPTEELPLSKAGRDLAAERKESLSNIHIQRCFSSPYRRARETAEILFGKPVLVDKLHERIPGTAPEDFWEKQYGNFDVKFPGGESLNEVRQRMKNALDSVLENLSEGETALVVSHATAICAYLTNYCSLTVVDPETKRRNITFHDTTVFEGSFNPTEYFILSFEADKLMDITFCSGSTRA